MNANSNATAADTRLSLTEVRAGLADIVNHAEYAGQVTTITRHGRAAARIVPAATATTGGLELDADLERRVGDFATSRGLDRNEALAALLRAGLQASPATEVCPGAGHAWADATTPRQLWELAESEEVEVLFCGEVDPDVVTTGLELHGIKARGQWVVCAMDRHSDQPRLSIHATKAEALAALRALIAQEVHQLGGYEDIWMEAFGTAAKQLLPTT